MGEIRSKTCEHRCDGVMLDPSDLDASHAACQFNGKPGFVWWEGLILSLCYAIYVHSMIIDEELMVSPNATI